MSDINFNDTTTKAQAAGSIPTGLSSVDNIDAFVDSDNSSSTDAFRVYHDVTTPTGAKLLFTLQENLQNAMNTDAPFQNVGGASGDLASPDYTGLHIKSAGNAATLILEAGHNSTPAADIFMVSTGSRFRLGIDNAQSGLRLSNPAAALTTNTNNIALFNANGGMSLFKADAPDRGLWIETNPDENLMRFFQRVSGSDKSVGRMLGHAQSDNQGQWMSLDPIDNSAGDYNLGIQLKGTTAGLPALVGVGHTTPTYQVDIQRSSGAQTVLLNGVTNTTGHTLKAYRNLASANTDSPVAFIHQDNAGDDQVALQVQQDAAVDIIKLFAGATEELAVTNAGAIKIQGTQVVTTRQAAVTAPTGGAVIDPEARTAINDLIARLQAHGLIS